MSPACSIPGAPVILQHVRQNGKYWCIPAGIEGMLKCVGLNMVSQEELVLAYCQKFCNESLSANGKYVSLDDFNAMQILCVAHEAVLAQADFKTFAEISSYRDDKNSFRVN